MKGIEVRPSQYLAAADQRFASAKRLAEGEWHDLAGATYYAGLAVECALQAFRPPHEALLPDHDLEKLVGKGIARRASFAQRNMLICLLGKLRKLWQNSIRYYSNDRFEAFCRKRAIERKVYHRKGSYAREHVSAAFSVAETILRECKALWQ